MEETRQARRLVRASMVAALLAGGVLAQGATNVWTGAVGAEWQSASSWSLGRVPDAADWAKFETAADVAPPSDFGGVIWVDGAQVSVAVEAATRLAVKLSGTEASLTKRGLGVLTVSPVRGVNPGTVAVTQGELAFAGNGDEAPGAFDRLVVAAGATARVTESPIATRHGAVIHGGYTSKDALPDGYTESDYYYWFSSRLTTMPLYDFMWDTYFACPSDTRCYAVVVPEGDAKALAYEHRLTPAYLLERQEKMMMLTRAILLVETPLSGSYFLKNGTGGGAMSAWFVDGVQMGDLSWGGNSAATEYKRTFSTGWHELALSLWGEASYGWKQNWLRFSRTSPADGESGLLTEDNLWLGVCFNAIDLADGGSLVIADGQALGISTSDNLNLSGSVRSETASAVLAVMSSYVRAGQTPDRVAKLTGLGSFVGVLELGRMAVVELPETAATDSFTVQGKGNVVLPGNGAEARLHESFEGIVTVPAGVTATLPAGCRAEVRGEGRVISASDTIRAALAGFAGETVLDPASEVLTPLNFSASSYDFGRAQLADGATYDLHRSDFVSRLEKTTVPDFSRAADWTLLGCTGIKAIVAPDGTRIPVEVDKLPYLDDMGALVLTDAPDKSRRGAFLTGAQIGEGEFLICSFDVHSYLPEPSPYAATHGWSKTCDRRAGGIGIVLCAGDPGEATARKNDEFLAWDGTCGLVVKYWETGTVQVLANGRQKSASVGMPAYGSLDLAKPYHVEVMCGYGKLVVTLSQASFSHTFVVEAARAFASADGKATLGILGSSDYWSDGNAALPWIRTEISNFSGTRWAARASFLTGDAAADENFTLGAVNWNAKGLARHEEDGRLLIGVAEGAHKFGRAICKRPIPARQAFELEYDVTFSMTATPSTASILAFLLQAEGENPTFAGGQDNGLDEISLKDTDGYGFSLETYSRTSNWIWGKGKGMTKASLPAQHVLTADKPCHVRVCYDGEGTMRLTVASDGVSQEGMHTFKPLGDETKSLYLTFSYSTTWGPCGTCHISNLTFTPRTSAARVDPTIRVAVGSGDQATIRLPAFAEDEADRSANGWIDLGVGARLTLAAADAAGTSAAFGRVSCAGAATLALDEGLCARIGAFAFAGETPQALCLTGGGRVAFADPLAFTMPTAWSRTGDFTLVDCAGVTLLGALPTELPLVGETGKAIRRGRVHAHPGRFVYLSNGFAVIVF